MTATLLDYSPTVEPARAILADDPSPSPNLTPSEQEDYARLCYNLIYSIPYCPWTPNPGPQSMFLADFSREALYGGAVGGSKSVGLLMAASQFLDIPGYAALILRKSFADLQRPKALMDLAETWWFGKPGVKFDRQNHTYIFDCPGGGTSKVAFGALGTVNDYLKFQGGAYHFVAYDELTQFTASDYRYLFSRIRRTTTGALSRIPIRLRSATNPGGPGHEWVYKRFIQKWAAWKAGTGPRPRRHFWPALLTDNPHLDREDYIQSLMELDPVTRAQLLRGDWNIRPDGRMFRQRWFRQITRDQLPGNCKWVRFWDWASTDPTVGRDPDYTVGALVGLDNHGRIFIADVRRWRKDPGDNDRLGRAVALLDTRRVVQAMEQEPGSAGKTAVYHYRTLVFNQSAFIAVPSSGKAKGRTTTLIGRKTPPAKIMAAGPFASMASAGMVYVVTDGSWDWDAVLDEFELFPDGEHDDIVDAVTLGYNYLAKYGVGAANVGDANEELVGYNEWRPEALPLDLGSEMTGTRVQYERVSEGLTRSDINLIARETAAAWNV